MTAAWIPVRAAQDPLSQDWARRYAQAINNTMNTQYLRYVPYGPSIPSVTDFRTTIKPQVDAITTNIMIGRVSVDEGLRQINDAKRTLGWDAINAELDAWYQKNRHLFGQ
jgi:putative aldouronate transport system substrate-binding protein